MNATAATATRQLSQFLRLAVVTGISRAVQVHIDRGDDLNARDGKGLTPLMLAAARNNAAICKLLIEAGADFGLLDTAGKTAYDLAIAARAHDAAAVISSFQIRLSEQAPFDTGHASEIGVTYEQTTQDLLGIKAKDTEHTIPPANTDAKVSFAHNRPASAPTKDLHDEGLAVAGTDAYTPPTQVDDTQRAASVDPDDDLECDLSGWIAEEDSVAPAEDPNIAVAASALQSAISLHTPIDSSDQWEDVDAFLPDSASRLSRTTDTETRSLLRTLILRAIREGVVSDREIDELSADEDGTQNPEARALLTMIINDLGAEVDDGLGSELLSNKASDNVPPESAEEEALLDDAFSFIDAASSHRNEPLRAYQREFQRIPLIKVEEEISLAQTMERSLEVAIDALATWPAGIARTISAGAEVAAGLQPRSWMSSGDAESDPEVENESGGSDDETDDSESDADLQSASPYILGGSSFSDALKSLEQRGARAAATPSEWKAVRETLSELNLSRCFLLELADISDAAQPEAQTKYLKAVAAYQKARNAMTCANLKLAFHIAKKYLYSGLPLDDLTQEANLGLLKAVDKYDWRRGFKFSTYATWWIRQQVSRHVADKSRTIRTPVHIFEKLQRIRRATDDFEASNGRLPKAAELAELIGMPLHKAEGLMRLLPDPVSLHDISIDEHISAAEQGAFIEEDPMEIASSTELATSVRKLLDTLKIKESQILCLRYGIGGQEPMTLDEVGKCFGVTRERVRQIESKLISRLRTAVQFAREAIEVDNSHQPRRQRFNHDHEDIDDLFIGDKIEAEQRADASDDAIECLRDMIPETKQRNPSNGSKDAKLSAIDAILALASELDIPYDDDRNGNSGRVWINFVDTPDSRHRKFARKLLENGFAFWPGRGYWR